MVRTLTRSRRPCQGPTRIYLGPAFDYSNMPEEALCFGPNKEIPLGPKLLHYITLLFRINFPDYVTILYITELVSN